MADTESIVNAACIKLEYSDCELEFTDEEALPPELPEIKTEMVLPAQNKPFKINKWKHSCTVCGKMFAKLNKLKRHEIVHSTERQYKCIDCPKAFKQKFSLDRHQLQDHQGERRFKCRDCPIRFAQLKSLARHLKAAHSLQPSESIGGSCPHCNCIYRQSNSLSRHIRVHHAELSAINELPYSDDPAMLAQNVLQQLNCIESEIVPKEISAETTSDMETATIEEEYTDTAVMRKD